MYRFGQVLEGENLSNKQRKETSDLAKATEEIGEALLDHNAGKNCYIIYISVYLFSRYHPLSSLLPLLLPFPLPHSIPFVLSFYLSISPDVTQNATTLSNNPLRYIVDKQLPLVSHPQVQRALEYLWQNRMVKRKSGGSYLRKILPNILDAALYTPKYRFVLAGFCYVLFLSLFTTCKENYRLLYYKYLYPYLFSEKVTNHILLSILQLYYLVLPVTIHQYSINLKD